MLRPLPPLNALRAFEAAGRHENFSRAAEELGVSHSAISRHVRGLEDRLGISLFRDLPRGVALSREGRSYLGRVSAALDLISDATEALGGGAEGRITVSCEPLFARKVLIPLLGGFHAQFPNIDLRLEASMTLADVNRYEADLAIRFAHAGHLDVPSDLISETPIFAYAAPQLRPQGWRHAQDVLPYRLLRDRDTDLWPQWGQRMGLKPEPFEQSSWRMSADLALEAAVCGQGVYLGAADCAQQDCDAGRLLRCFDVGLHDGAMRLLQGERAARNKAARAFRNWLLDETMGLRRGAVAPL